MNVFELFAVLKLNKDQFSKELENAQGEGSKFGSAMAAVGTAAAAGIAAAGTAVVSITKEAVSAYANYEQLAGGVETLFGSSAETVIENASNAFKTAGLSANDYMETVTSFSASLLQSLDGDTQKAASEADMAITDMSDNANKMGTSMESISTAYAGFAKQNFTLLDNLKLGYGGTKEEMERLLADATALSGVEYDISSYSDIVDAIHVVQTEMGITGTTAKEASETISGSLDSTKSAWENLITGLGQGDDISGLMENLAESATNVVNNIIPVVENVLTTGLPVMISYGSEMLTSLVDGITQQLPSLATTASQIFTTFLNVIISALPQLINAGLQVIVTLAESISGSLPELIPTIVDVVLQIVNTLTDPNTLSSLLEAALAIIVALAEGIVESIPELVSIAPTIIENLVTAIVEALPALLDAAWQLIQTLANGIISYTSEVNEKGPKLVQSLLDGIVSALTTIATWVWENWISPIVDAIQDKISEFTSMGKNIVEGLWNGINDKAQWIKDKVTGFVSSIGSTIKEFFGIASPSKLTKEYGRFIAEGLAVGFDGKMTDVERTIGSDLNDLTDSMSGNIDLGMNTISPSDSFLGSIRTATAQASNTASPAIEIPIYLDSLEIARGIYGNLDELSMLKGATA